MRASKRLKTPRLVASIMVVLGLVFSACTTGAESTAQSTAQSGSAADTDRSAQGSSFGLPNFDAAGASNGGADGPDELAFADSAQILPPTGPGGAPFAGCSMDYGSIDWEADARTIVEAHTAVSMAPCTGESWYRDTAFQNGILTFMVLVGQDALAAAPRGSEDAENMVASLHGQGFDRLAKMEVAASGRCDEGEIQAALFTLLDSAAVDGLDSMVESAMANGATVVRQQRFTTIIGGGAPCATAIIHNDRTLGWVTAGDRAGLDLVLTRLTYT